MEKLCGCPKMERGQQGNRHQTVEGLHVFRGLLRGGGGGGGGGVALPRGLQTKLLLSIFGGGLQTVTFFQAQSLKFISIFRPGTDSQSSPKLRYILSIVP